MPKKSKVARRFRAEAEIDPQSTPGRSNGTVVTICDGDAIVRAEKGNYPSFAVETFEPFEIGDLGWYALYSSNYTATRVMKLPECRDLGGEEPSSGGFCPVELFVPRYRNVETKNRTTGQTTTWVFYE